MKAAHNGIPSLSILDGWFIEGHEEGVTGWSIGTESQLSDEEDAANLYKKLENVVIPAFYSSEWVNAVIGSIAHNASHFHTHRMVEEYAQQAWNLSLEDRVAA